MPYGIPPEKLIPTQPVTYPSSEHPQLKAMMKDVPDTADTPVHSWVNNVVKKAGALGVSAAYWQEKPLGSEKTHEYLVFSTDAKAMKSLVEGRYKDFPEWLERQKFQMGGIVLLDKVVIDITDIDRHNYFSKNSYIMRYVQNMAIAKTAFEYEGYPVPDHVSKYVVSSIWELDQMRGNKGLSKVMKERYDKTYKAAVADYAQSYATKYQLKVLPREGQHRVKEDYFRDNHVAVMWDVVNEEFWQFIQAELRAGKYPDFIYYKADEPFLKTKNLAKEYDKVTKGKLFGLNFWSKDKGNTKYHFCFPLAQEDMFYSMLNDFNTRIFDTKVSIEELQKSSQYPLQTIYLHSYDMSNWHTLCAPSACNMKWAVNNGSYGECKITSKSAFKEIPVLYRVEDKDSVNYIVNRLAREMRDYVPMSDATLSERTNRGLESIHKAAQQIEARERSKNKNNDMDR